MTGERRLPVLAWAPPLRDRVRRNLDSFVRASPAVSGRRAAVAIAVLSGEDGEAALPLFLRQPGLARHAGQMGLPGGRAEDGEDGVEAALRELHEELGIAAGLESVLGTLDDFPTRSGFVITPVVLWSEAPASELRPGPGGEIARLYVLPLAELRRAVDAAAPGSSEAFCLRFAWGNVYAPTAAILFQFSQVALAGRTVRVRDFYQPPFTWR